MLSSCNCFTSSISHGVECHFPRLGEGGGTGIYDAIFEFNKSSDIRIYSSSLSIVG